MITPKSSKVRFGKLVADIVYTDLRAKRAIVVGYGLLSSPMSHHTPIVKKLANSGFLIFIPRYYGTYESDGVCTFENAANSMLDTVKLVKLGKAQDAWGEKLRWNAKQIILAGGSFGGSAALVAGAKSKDVKKIVAVATPTDYRTKRGIAAYRVIWSIGYKNTWRCAKNAWKKFIAGDIDLNAIDYTEQLKKKDVLLMHGSKDKIVSPKYSELLYNKLADGKGFHKLIIIKGAGHSSIMGFLMRPGVFKQFVEWLKK